MLLFMFLSVLQAQIVTTSPVLTEMVTVLGRESEIVGRTPYCLDAKNAKVTGSALQLDFEKILALKPRLVLLQENAKTQNAQKLERLGLKVLSFKIESFKDVMSAYRTLADALKSEPMDYTFKSYQSEKSLLFMIGAGSPGRSVMLAGSDTLYADLVTQSNLHYAVTQNGWPNLDAEQMRALVKDKKHIIIEVNNDQTRHWSKTQWQSFCPACQVKQVVSKRLLYPGVLAISEFQTLLGELEL